MFNDEYRLRSRGEVEKYISKNHHLPEIESADIMATDGMNIGELNRKLLQKVEELTLYLIKEHKKNQNQQQQIDDLKNQVTTIRR